MKKRLREKIKKFYDQGYYMPDGVLVVPEIKKKSTFFRATGFSKRYRFNA